jgi:hypothetical protein
MHTRFYPQSMDACVQIAEVVILCMTIEQYKESLAQKSPPHSLSIYLKALWFDAKNDWEKSHTIIQNIEDNTASWIHACLHRKEGDTGNADYWYRRAGRKRPDVSLEKEWEDIVKELLIIHN